VQAFSTYFRLIDVTSTSGDHYLDRKAYEAANEQERGGPSGRWKRSGSTRVRAVLRPLYEQMDRRSRIPRRMDARRCSSCAPMHGFRFFQGAYSHANPAPGAARRRGVRAGREFAGPAPDGASVYDIAPTILYALGQPAASDMDGTVLRSPSTRAC